MTGSPTIPLAAGQRRFVFAWCSVLALFVAILGVEAIAVGSVLAASVSAAIIALLCLVGWRWSSLSVTAMEDRLMIRQFFTTRVVRRSDVSSFRVGGGRRETPGVAVGAVLPDGQT